jgi:hypothetical protein
VAKPITDQSATENVAFRLQFAADTFQDPDAGDVLAYSATLDGGSPLPAWLSFDAATRTFSGRPGFADDGQLVVVVRAADGGTPPLADETSFALTVLETARPWQNPMNRRDVDASGQPGEPFPKDVLTVINFINVHQSIELPKPPSPLGPPPYLDVTGDGWVTAADVLDIINFINSRVAGEGEPEPMFVPLPLVDNPGNNTQAMSPPGAAAATASQDNVYTRRDWLRPVVEQRAAIQACASRVRVRATSADNWRGLMTKGVMEDGMLDDVLSDIAADVADAWLLPSVGW